MCFQCCHWMDQVPVSHGNTVVIPPLTGTTECFGGVYNCYDPTYPTELTRCLKANEFEEAMERINDTLQAYWPCCFCFNFGYVCCLPTLGLALLVPNACVNTAVDRLNHELSVLNDQYRDRRLTFSFKRQGLYSWLEIEVPYTIITTRPYQQGPPSEPIVTKDEVKTRTNDPRTPLLP